MRKIQDKLKYLKRSLNLRILTGFVKLHLLKSDFGKGLYYRYKTQGRLTPVSVQIESTNACNYNCIMCYRKTVKDKIGFMELSRFKSLVDECASIGVNHIKPQFRGEALLHPDIIEMILYVKSKGISCQMTTTAKRLDNPVLLNGLINSGLDILTVSFHGVSRESYKAIHGKDYFNVVKTNLETMYLLRGRRKTPVIKLQTTVMDVNKDEAEKSFEMFKDIVDEIQVYPCSYHPATMVEDHRVIKSVCERKNRCLTPLNSMTISWDGKVTVCCVDCNFEMGLGNIKTDSLMDIFNSDKWNRLRKGHLNKDFKNRVICEECV